MKTKKNKSIKIPKYKIIIAYIITLFIIILPWISRLKVITLDNDTASIFPNDGGMFIDIFLYYKALIIIIFSCSIILFFIGEIIFPDNRVKNIPLFEKKNKIIVLSAFGYIAFVIISYIFSSNRGIGLMGAPTEFEGVLVLISYIILFFAGMNYFSKEKAKSILKNGLIILMLILVCTTIVEFLYKPIFEIEFIRSLLAPDKYRKILDSLKTKEFDNMVALTFYNPNYFGGMCALLFPLSISNFLIENNKNKKYLLILLSVGMMFSVFASKSTGAIYVMFIEVLALLILLRKQLRNNIKEIIISIGILAITFISINIISSNKLFNVIVDGLANTHTIEEQKEKFQLKDINIDGNELIIEGEKESLIIQVDPNKMSNFDSFNFYNGQKESIEIEIKESKVYFKDNIFKDISVENRQYGIVVDIGYEDSMNFYVTQDGFKGVGQAGSIIDKITIENPILESFYSFATGRGYSWVNSLPILKETIILGKGPGTFAFNIQQNDYVGLMNTHGSTKFILDKPHNMYIQIATQTGIISLLLLLIIICIIVSRAYKYLKKSDDYMGIGLLISVVGFLIIGMVNDSIVTVNPIFWILLGVLSNFKYTNKEDSK